MDAYDYFEIPARFDIDLKDLHQRFIRATAAAHPDRYEDPSDQLDAADASAKINDAYAALKDPESRANVLLVKLGGAGKDKDQSLPPEFLMEMMEVRERLEEAVVSEDGGMQKGLERWAHDERETRLGRVAELFTLTDAKVDARTLKQIRLELNALRYIERMIEQIPD